MTSNEFFKSLSEAEWDEAEGVAQLAHSLCRGLTEDTELLFVRAALERKSTNPAAPGIELLNAGLVALGKAPITRQSGRRQNRLTGARLSEAAK